MVRRRQLPPPEPIDMESADNPDLEFKKFAELTIAGKVSRKQALARIAFQRGMRRAARPPVSFWWPFKGLKLSPP